MIVALMCLSTAFTLNANAQNKRNEFRIKMNPEKMDSLQTKRMVNELLLNDVTTAKFIPIYTNYLSEIRNLRIPANKDFNKRGKQINEKSDAEIQKMIEDHFVKSQKTLDIRIKYYKEFKRFLSPKQIAKMYQLERPNGPKMGRPLNFQGGHKMMGRKPNGQGCPMEENKENLTLPDSISK